MNIDFFSFQLLADSGFVVPSAESLQQPLFDGIAWGMDAAKAVLAFMGGTALVVYLFKR